VSQQEQVETLTVDGVDVVRYHKLGEKEPWADRAVLLMPVEPAVPLILAAMPGWSFIPDLDVDPIAGAALADALLDAGAVLQRHAFGYTFALDSGVDPTWADPVLPAGAELAPILGVSDGLVDLVRRAFPPGHPDHAMDDWDPVAGLATLIERQTLGPILDGTVQVLRRGRPLAALIINRFVGSPPYGGPWVSDVFRDPDDPAARGLGSVLIRRALAVLAAAGEPALTLAVTAGNPAAQRYEALGFTRCWEARRLRLPPR
jgi:GNAT superfamily N-acetyltransferase